MESITEPATAPIPDGTPSADEILELRGEVEMTSTMMSIEEMSEKEITVLRYLRRRSIVAEEIVRVKEQTDAMIRDLENKLKGLDYVYTGLAREYAMIRTAGGKSKSVKTPFATIGFRKEKALFVVVDPEKVIAFARATPGAEGCVCDKPVLVKAELDKFIEREGIVPDGVTIRPESEKFYVK